MNRLEKTIAVSLQAAAGALLFSAGNLMSADDIYLIFLGVPGVAAGVGGMLLWGKAAKRTDERADRPLRLNDDTTSEMLRALQEEVNGMREEREFLQQLYVGAADAKVGYDQPREAAVARRG